MPARSNQLRVLAVALPVTVAVVCLLAFAGPVANAASGPAGNELIQIPLRWCALKGTKAVTDPGYFGAPNTTSVLLNRQMRANILVLTPGANIAFRSPFPAPAPATTARFPVIDDPWPPAGGLGSAVEHGRLGPGDHGDILRPTEGDPESFAEWNLARTECEEDWDAKARSLGVSIKRLV